MWTSARPPSDMGLVASRHAADSPRASDGLLTGGGRAGIRLMPTFCDIPRWAAARRRAIHGRETDTPRAYHGRFPYGRETGGTWACLRTSDGRATGGLRSDLDKPRDTKMGGGCAATGYTRTCLRAAYGRHNDTRQDRCAGRREGTPPPPHEVQEARRVPLRGLMARIGLLQSQSEKGGHPAALRFF